MAALAPPSYGSRNAHIEQPVSNGPYTTPRFVWNAKCTDSLIDNLQRAVFALSASASMFVCDSYIIGGQDAQLVGRVFFPKLPYGQFCGPEDFREPQASTCSLYATKDCLFVLLGTKTDQRSIHDVVDGIFSKWGGLKDVVALDSVALEEVERANSSAAPSPATSSKLWSLSTSCGTSVATVSPLPTECLVQGTCATVLSYCEARGLAASAVFTTVDVLNSDIDSDAKSFCKLQSLPSFLPPSAEKSGDDRTRALNNARAVLRGEAMFCVISAATAASPAGRTADSGLYL